MTAAPTVVQEIADEPTVVDGFGDDPLGRVQGLLFGDHAQRTNERLDSIEQTLFDMVTDLRASIKAELSLLSEKLSLEIAARDEQASKLDQRIGQEVKTLTKANNALGRKLDKASDTLSARLVDAAEAASNGLESVRQDLTSELMALHSATVERAGLAALLRNVANDLDT